MVYTFEYSINGQITFRGNLRGQQCIGHKKDGRRCSRRSVIGCPYCFQHLKSERHLRIKPSTIHNAGKGLFAEDNTQPPNAIIFRRGDDIIEYIGENIDRQELNRRYQIHTAPYALQVRGNDNVRGPLYIDAATIRGVGSLSNHNRSNHQNTRFVVDFRNNTAKLRATKNIRNNQEIFVNYGHEYRIHEAGVRYRTIGVR
jgi:SET domain-containing protein